MTQESPHPDEPPRVDLAALLEHQDFVRNLAYRLLEGGPAAEDVIQDTWLHAIRRPPEHALSIKGWLATVVRNRARNLYRLEKSRKEREAAFAQREARSSAARLALPPELRELLSKALQSMAPAYAEALQLHLFEELSAAQIADRIGVSPKTVHTRLRRGLDTLRQKLRREYKGRRSWQAALLPFALRQGNPEQKAFSTSHVDPGSPARHVRTLSARPIIAWGAAALLVGAAWWIARTTPALPQGTTAPELAESMPAAGPGIGSNSAERFSQSREVTSDLRSVTGLRISTVDESSSPVPHVRLLLRGPARTEASTDESGSLMIPSIAAGQWTVHPERGVARFVSVRTGETAFLQLTIPDGRTVKGIVLDDSELPIADSEILCSWPALPEELVPRGRSDSTGQFRIVNVDPECWVGAISPAHADSKLEFVGHDPAPRALVCPPDLRAAVTVVDSSGRTVVGAVLHLRPRFADLVDLGSTGIKTRLFPEKSTRTNESGLARFRGLRRTEYELELSAPGFARQRRPVATSAGDVELRATLHPSSTVTGRLTTESGEPVANARVEARFGRFILPPVSSQVDGTFELPQVPAGKAQLRAFHPVKGSALGERSITEGSRVRWNAALSTNKCITGTVRSPTGVPYQGWSVTATTSANGWSGSPVPAISGITNSRGEFSLPTWDDSPQVVSVHPSLTNRSFPIAWHSGARPGQPIDLRVDPDRSAAARVHGSVQAPQGSPPDRMSGAVVTLVHELFATDDSVAVDPAGGTFEFTKLPPGKYQLFLQLSGRPREQLGEYELNDDTVLELPPRQAAQCGALELVQTSNRVKRLRVDIYPVGEPTETPNGLSTDSLASCFNELFPGSYEISVAGYRVPKTIIPFEIRPGETTFVHLPGQGGRIRRIRMECPAPTQDIGPLSWSLTDDRGQIVRAREFPGVPYEEQIVEWAGALHPGDYTIHAVREDLQEVRIPVTVEDHPSRETIVVPLEPLESDH